MLLPDVSEKDSINLSYSYFPTYQIINTGINLNNSDSLSDFYLAGHNTRTIYDKFSKNDLEITSSFAAKKADFSFGGLISTNYVSNSSVTRPTNNSISLMPLICYTKESVKLNAAAGYLSKVDEVSDKTGFGIDINGRYDGKHDSGIISLNSDLEADGLDKDINYNSSSGVIFTKDLDQQSGTISAGGSGNFLQYHFSDFTNNDFRIKRYEYDINAGFLYNASEKLRNNSIVRFYARNKDSYRNGSLLSFNSNSDISLSDEIMFSTGRLFTSLKGEFDTGSDKYSMDFEENDKSLSFYNFSLSSQANYSYSDYIFGLYGRYFKHEYKSLSNSNLEDRDIVKISLKPDVTYNRRRSLNVTQSFPLDYYKLINISSLRSGNNYTDRVVNSVTDIKNVFSSNLYITGKIHLRSYFRSYEYDDTFKNSFVIKNYSFSDTVSYKLNRILSAKLSTRYIYEETGNFNYDDFTENPQTYKNHYYTSFSMTLGTVRYIRITSEYYFYEIDSYKFDQDDFDRSDLVNVYISHGPKVGFNFLYNKFSLFTGLEIDNFRNEESSLRFRIESYISFE